MKIISILPLILLLAHCDLRSQTKSKTDMITIESIEEIYSNMKANGVNTDTTMLYGYFFTNRTPNQFEKVTEELANQGFEFVEIFQDDDKMYWLHLERKEIHSSETLFALNKKLYAIAEKYLLYSYDGFDVGNVDKEKPLATDTYFVPDDFRVTDFMKEGYPTLLVGNIAFDGFSHKQEFSHFIKITCQFKTTDNVMLPSKKDLNKLDKFDSYIEEEFVGKKLKAYYVFRETFKGLRKVFMATNDKDLAIEILTEIQKNKRSIPFEFEILTDKEWKLYGDIRTKFTKE